MMFGLTMPITKLIALILVSVEIFRNPQSRVISVSLVSLEEMIVPYVGICSCLNKFNNLGEMR